MLCVYRSLAPLHFLQLPRARHRSVAFVLPFYVYCGVEKDSAVAVAVPMDTGREELEGSTLLWTFWCVVQFDCQSSY
jgi:hypothetical protein